MRTSGDDPTAGSAGVSPASLRNAIGWHSRGFLPHFDQPGLVQMVTFRLADALPLTRIQQLDEEFGGSKNPKWRMGLEEYMDAGHGACYLRDPEVARIVEAALLHFDSARYRMAAWAVMPNHVHAIIETLPSFTLSQIVGSWKSFTSKEINKYLGHEGRLWQPESFDRMIRDEKHLASAINYIYENPVKAGLVHSAEEWPFSSARLAGGTPALPASDSISGSLKESSVGPGGI